MVFLSATDIVVTSKVAPERHKEKNVVQVIVLLEVLSFLCN